MPPREAASSATYETQKEFAVKAKTIYLDNNATTRCAKEVVDAMLPHFQSDYGNSASPHLLGRQATSAVAKAREQIADSLSCDAREIFFTSGATEANNLVLLGLSSCSGSRQKIVTSAIEHSSVLEPLEYLAQRGFCVVTLPVSSEGVVDPVFAEKVVDDDTLLVSVQAANNEVGTLQPVAELARLAHAHGAIMHCDATQLLGKLPVSIPELSADVLSFSSHKAYGPKGIGFLVARNSLGMKKLPPVFFGGGQEGGLRPGTLNVPGIVGTGVACEMCYAHASEEQKRISGLRDDLEARLRGRVPCVSFACSSATRLPGTTTMLVPGIPADLLISRVPDVCMSLGSACSSGALAPSHVLLALGYSREDARTAVRLSLGRYNTSEEIEEAGRRIGNAINGIWEENPNLA
jgi:cysteine desulfurase